MRLNIQYCDVAHRNSAKNLHVCFTGSVNIMIINMAYKLFVYLHILHTLIKNVLFAHFSLIQKASP